MTSRAGVVVGLSVEQSEYLKDASFLRGELRAAATNEAKLERCVRLFLDRKIADELASALTERLAEVGFDSQYSLTPEGVMIDSLIEVLAKR